MPLCLNILLTMNLLLIFALLLNIMPQNEETYSFHIKRVYTYNNETDTIKSSKLSYNNEGELISKVIYHYDRNNNKIKTEKFNQDSTLITKYDYTFDDNNLKTKSIKTDCIKNIIITKEYVNSKEGKILRKKEIIDGELIKTSFYSYNKEGNTSTLSTYDKEGVLKSEFSYEYKYDSEGKIIEKRSYKSDKKHFKTQEYLYNNKKQKTHTYSYYISGSRKDSKRVYTFDDQDRKTGSIVYNKD